MAEFEPDRDGAKGLDRDNTRQARQFVDNTQGLGIGHGDAHIITLGQIVLNIDDPVDCVDPVHGTQQHRKRQGDAQHAEARPATASA